MIVSPGAPALLPVPLPRRQPNAADACFPVAERQRAPRDSSALSAADQCPWKHGLKPPATE